MTWSSHNMNKHMKKTISFLTMFAMVFMALPAMATGTSNIQPVETSFIRDSSGGVAPVVEVKWEMYAESHGVDSSTTAGAQFLPSGQYQKDTTITVCGIVTDGDGMDDINAVYGDIWYPEGIWLGPDHETGRQGCGNQHGNEFKLTRLSKTAGIELFCNDIRNNNNNLPTWLKETVNYDYVCAETGILHKDLGAVYCGNHTLSYEDPSGEYRTLVMAQDKWGVDGKLYNYFKYMDLTAFETDFASVVYGNVKLNTHKIINGDLTWEPGSSENLATVRNVGNTRLAMKVMQDDMDMGKTDNQYNVRWDARVGSDASYKQYWPYQTAVLNNPLNLSEMDEMDFSIEVFKFPPEMEDGFVGSMTLSANKVAHYGCCRGAVEGTYTICVD